MRSEIRSDDFAHYFQADKRFHLALVAAAGNRLISAALVPLISTMDQTLYREFTHRYYLKTAEDLEQVVDLHEELVRAIEKKGSGKRRAPPCRSTGAGCERPPTHEGARSRNG